MACFSCWQQCHNSVTPTRALILRTRCSMGTLTAGYPLTALWINNPDTDHRHRHRGGMLTKTPPPTELQIPATVTTLLEMNKICWTHHCRWCWYTLWAITMCHFIFDINYHFSRWIFPLCVPLQTRTNAVQFTYYDYFIWSFWWTVKYHIRQKHIQNTDEIWMLLTLLKMISGDVNWQHVSVSRACKFEITLRFIFAVT